MREYTIVEAGSDTLADAVRMLEERVAMYMRRDWQPQGGIAIVCAPQTIPTVIPGMWYTACQAMTREKPQSDTIEGKA